MKPYFFYIAILVVGCLTGCKPNFEEQTNRAIVDASNRFRQLPLLDSKVVGHFEQLRKVELIHPGVTMQLYAPTDVYYKQQVLVLSNPKGIFYAIPLPSIRFKSYWNFLYDTTPKPLPLKAGTFESEINKALDTLQLNKG